MKKVVIEETITETIHARQLKPQDLVIGVDRNTKMWVYLSWSGTHYVVIYLESIACEEAYINKTFHDMEDAIKTCANVQFYQFPDFRSAMEYYLEQSK